MQDHRNSLIHDRKAVMSMPIKLLIIMVILSLSIPIVYSAMEFNQESMMDVRMDKECDKIIGCVREIYYSGTGSIRTIDTELPQGCERTVSEILRRNSYIRPYQTQDDDRVGGQ